MGCALLADVRQYGLCRYFQKVLPCGLGQPATLASVWRATAGSAQSNVAALRQMQARTVGQVTFRDEIERMLSIDLNDPKVAGWTFLVHTNDPNRESIVERRKPLASAIGFPTE
jgi:hypothetical protein